MVLTGIVYYSCWQIIRTTAATSSLLYSCSLLVCQNTNKQSVALTERNRTGPPCSVSHPAAHAPVGRPARRQRYRRLQMTPTDDNDRRQRAKQYWPIRRAGNNTTVTTAAWINLIFYSVNDSSNYSVRKLTRFDRNSDIDEDCCC